MLPDQPPLPFHLQSARQLTAARKPVPRRFGPAGSEIASGTTRNVPPCFTYVSPFWPISGTLHSFLRNFFHPNHSALRISHSDLDCFGLFRHFPPSFPSRVTSQPGPIVLVLVLVLVLDPSRSTPHIPAFDANFSLSTLNHPGLYPRSNPRRHQHIPLREIAHWNS